MTQPFRWRALPIMALGMLACAHADPFEDGEGEKNGPPPNPQQLTLNRGSDQWPLWLDNETIWYSAQDSLAHDRDHCLVSIPARGGTYTTRQCPPEAQNNLTEVLQQPTILNGVVAFARADLGTFPPEHVQYRFGLWTAGLGHNAPRTLRMTFGYVAPSTTLHDAPISLRWVREDLLAYIGAEAGCCNKDTMRFGEQIVLLDLSTPVPTRTYLSNTFRASAMGVTADGLSLYYTFTGDSRVYLRNIASGVVTVLHDFGAGHIVRDPDIVGNRMVAVIDGEPGFRDLPPFDSVQIDHGGDLITVDLATGQETLRATENRWYKRPRLSPDGTRIVAEGYPYTRSGTPPVYSVSRSADLWIIEE